MNSSLTINSLKLSDADFERIVRANPEWNFEQTAAGDLVVVPPTGGTSGNRNSNLGYQLEAWNLASDAGKTFDSNTMFVLPNSAKRMPDASWVRRDRWDALTPQQQDGYPRLGWLINPQDRQVEIYRQGQQVEVLQSPTTLSGEDVLPGFVLNLQRIFA